MTLLPPDAAIAATRVHDVSLLTMTGHANSSSSIARKPYNEITAAKRQLMVAGFNPFYS